MSALSNSKPSTPKLRSWFSSATLPLGIGVVLMLVASFQLPQIEQEEAGLDPDADYRQRQQTIRTAQALGQLGFRNLAADWLWIDFIQYFGDLPLRLRFGYEQSSEYLDPITDLDPLFTQPYLYGTIAFAWKQGKPREAVQLLEKGLSSMNPNSNPFGYRLWYQVALLQFLWIGNIEAAQVALNQTADWIETIPEAERQPQGVLLNPASLRSLAGRIEESPRSAQVRFDIWVQVWRELRDPEAKQLALIEIEKLGGLRQLPDGTFELVRPDADAEIESTQ